MDRPSGKPTIHSIALLQERFRQLQRAKEIRQKRELLQLFSASEPLTLTNEAPSRLLCFCEQTPPARPPLHGSFLHQPNKKSTRSDLQHTETPLLVNIYAADDIMQETNNYNDSHVDTSLHL
ncbi:hypothetical protein AB3S75_017754 [Citrus x aurantiifolia]